MSTHRNTVIGSAYVPDSADRSKTNRTASNLEAYNGEEKLNCTPVFPWSCSDCFNTRQ